jgi:hypothetical protein
MSVVPLGTKVVYKSSWFLSINLRSLQLCFPLSFSVEELTYMSAFFVAMYHFVRLFCKVKFCSLPSWVIVHAVRNTVLKCKGYRNVPKFEISVVFVVSLVQFKYSILNWLRPVFVCHLLGKS